MEILISMIVFAVIIFFVLSYSSLSWGWVLFKFWGWFVLPIFTMLPTLYYWDAVGLMMVITLFNRNSTMIKDEYIDQDKGFFIIIISPWFSLLLGWIVKSIWL